MHCKLQIDKWTRGTFYVQYIEAVIKNIKKLLHTA